MPAAMPVAAVAFIGSGTTITLPNVATSVAGVAFANTR
jgi:hypothetical protein